MTVVRTRSLRVPLQDLTNLALELAERTRRSELTGRSYTVAEHAVILSTYVRPGLEYLSLVHDAMRLDILPGHTPQLALADILAAEERLARDESGIAFMPPLHAAHVYLERLLEFKDQI